MTTMLSTQIEYNHLVQDDRRCSMLRTEGAPEGFRNLGLNGSYLVVRELRQYVGAFWKSVDAAAAGRGRRQLSGEQPKSHGLSPLSPTRIAGHQQSGGVVGRRDQRAGEGAIEILEPARGGGSDPASAGGGVERRRAAGETSRRPPRLPLPLQPPPLRKDERPARLSQHTDSLAVSGGRGLLI